MQKWGLVDSAHCECGDPSQTVEHIISSYPKHRPLNGDRGLKDLDDDTLDWLASTELKGTPGEEEVPLGELLLNSDCKWHT
ncbi:hypothetical protein AAFF_G00429850 [Aldrovandia affinis]|uniref:Uncharacterized protein n=1 Tax=Aldrovandia affinis TaxID=143900 RepID=A0AAD7WID3_9TELE|nr:hypothetical protein AAFF_G00429850 [Aldrovandia affinis]